MPFNGLESRVSFPNASGSPFLYCIRHPERTVVSWSSSSSKHNPTPGPCVRLSLPPLVETWVLLDSVPKSSAGKAMRRGLHWSALVEGDDLNFGGKLEVSNLTFIVKVLGEIILGTFGLEASTLRCKTHLCQLFPGPRIQAGIVYLNHNDSGVWTNAGLALLYYHRPNKSLFSQHVLLQKPYIDTNEKGTSMVQCHGCILTWSVKN